ncbi:MAG: Holliday junction branch migration protein RuvA [Spirochaetales bacterium]|nr:Holliday junction branch migration protein RuvA [Spirochaetales bacterium]
MWNSITGRITEKGEDSLFLQAGAMEWDLSVSGYTLSKLPSPGNEARIYTYLHHKEDGMRLFGFFDEVERNVFNELLKVGGIGPKGALKILSGISPEGFLRTLDDGDVDGLCRLPGLGKKTAQKIVLSLRGKLTMPEDDDNKVEEHSEIVDSLVNMGFERKQAKDAVKKATIGVTGSKTQVEGEIFRLALVELSS